MRTAKQIWQRWLGRCPDSWSTEPPPTDPIAADELRLRRVPDVVERRLGDDLFLVHLAEGSVYRLNRTGVVVWEFAAERLTAEEIADRLHATWGVPREQLRRDVRTLLSDLVARRLAEPVPGVVS